MIGKKKSEFKILSGEDIATRKGNNEPILTNSAKAQIVIKRNNNKRWTLFFLLKFS